jgi:hypothetical protein
LCTLVSFDLDHTSCALCETPRWQDQQDYSEQPVDVIDLCGEEEEDPPKEEAAVEAAPPPAPSSSITGYLGALAREREARAAARRPSPHDDDGLMPGEATARAAGRSQRWLLLGSDGAVALRHV